MARRNYYEDQDKPKGYTPTDVMHINAALSMVGMLLGHSKDVKAIKTDADIRKDELRYKIKQTQKENNMAIEQMSLDIALKQMNTLDRKVSDAEESYYKLTHERYKYNDEDLTKQGEKLVKDNKANAENRLYQLRDTSENEVQIRKDKIKALERDTQKIQKSLDFIDKNYSYSAGGDSTIYDAADYDATIAMMDDMLGIDSSEDADILAALKVKQPSLLAIQGRNEELTSLQQRNVRFNQSQDMSAAGHYGNAHQFIKNMVQTYTASETGQESGMQEKLRDGLTTAYKEGVPYLGVVNVKEKDHIENIILNVQQSFAGGPEGMRRLIEQKPYLETILSNLFPMQWVEYKLHYDRWRNAIEGGESKVPQNKNQSSSTINSETSAGKALGYFD